MKIKTESQEKILREIETFGISNSYPIIMNESLQVLLDEIEKIEPKKILEIGTCIGYSGSVMLLNSNAHLTTLEINEESAKIAKDNFEKIGVSKRVKLLVGDAKVFIDNAEEKFDFIFLDGPKGQYKNYLPKLMELIEDEGVIFADNIYFKGYVNLSENEFLPRGIRTIVRNLREFNSMVKSNPILDSTFLDIGDGICIIKKLRRNENV